VSSLRITSGTLKGRRVAVPPGDVRPTSERARQAYFNIIGSRINGAHFLDLYAGSGVFSFEAMSRGAASATAVDRDQRNLTAITKQAAAFGVPVETIASDVIPALKRVSHTIDLVYCDPPYDFSDYGRLVAAIASIDLAPDAIVAVEHRRGTSPFQERIASLEQWRRAEYSEVWITFFTPSSSLPQPLQ
jgi:16S rRNA (guanine966-N2)-methyltransferase